MLNDLNETIKQLLVDGVPLDLSEVDVAFDAPNQEWSGSLARPTVNCYLYYLVENRELRHTDWELDRSEGLREKRNGDGLAHSMMRRRVPFRVDCHYLLTAWANAVEDEHRLLWRMMSALLRYQEIPFAMLKGDLATQEWPVHTKVAQPESIMKNPSDFWSGMEAPIKPSINFVATLPLDPSIDWELPLVLTRGIKLYPEVRGVEGVELPPIQFGGWVLAKSGDGGQLVSVPDAEVLIVERGVTTVSDEQGRFRFDAIQRGNYTLRATSKQGRVERQIELPQQDYDLVLTDNNPVGAKHTSPPQNNPGESGSRESGEPPASRQGGKSRRR